MRSLLYFLKNSKKKYIAVYPDKYTKEKLTEYATDCGFDIASDHGKLGFSFDFHITIFYSESRHHNIANGMFKIEPFSVKAKELALLGVDNDVPVLKVESAGLRKIRQRYENMGMKDKWGDYVPHISLSYNYKDEPKIETLELPKFPLIFDTLKIEDQDENT